ncbi:MAG: glycoside hydrolase family 3 N-terminal domain-containing protein [Bacteroidota bacterium]
MKKVFKITGLFFLIAIIIVAVYALINNIKRSNIVKENYALLGDEAGILNVDGNTFRDLNKNGKLDIYEDTRASINNRVEDLISQMNLEEKAGTMFVTMIGMTKEGKPLDMPVISTNAMEMAFSFMLPPSSEMIALKKMNSFNIVHSYNADILARFNNNAQKLAERTRLGIPITIATDPRHGTQNNPGAAIFTPSFSQWPSSLGLAATRDTLLVREFGDIARQEYNSVGIKLALHPMADLATEPRWGRTNGTFGEDANLSAAITKAYVLGFQGDSLTSSSVACMTKHFSGGGPQKDGEDPHFPYGKEQAYPGNNFEYHLIPFIKGAFPAKTAQIMPYYGIPMDQTDENVAFAFNKTIITKILRDSLKFDGVICTDWNIISDSKMGEARAWGVEELTPILRVKKVIDAGCDQFGGENDPSLIVELVKSGKISEKRIDISVKRILRDKFILGLFDNPYVDEELALKIAGNSVFITKGKEAQAKSAVLLKNKELLPLAEGTKIYTDGMINPEVLNKYGQVVDDIDQADVILTRIRTPFDKRSEFFLERFFHQGRLYYNEKEKKKIFDLIDKKPALVVVNLERPAILTEINEKCDALMADFGTSDEVLAELIFGKVKPSGKLPFELPSTWEAVQKQLEDVPYDSENPLYKFGDGISYK